MTIVSTTKIASIIQANPRALDAIVGISSKFEKLRNPLLFKLMAKRTSIAMACKIASCNFSDFEKALRPLGFNFQVSEEKAIPLVQNWQVEDHYHVVSLDVRPILQYGLDPLKSIMTKVNELKKYEILEITNSFLPSPLINLFTKRGFGYRILEQSLEKVVVQFCVYEQKIELSNVVQIDESNDWQYLYDKYKNQWKEIEVRQMQMPMPMITILNELDQLEKGEVLFVRHHKLPVFLLPELSDRKVTYRINRLNDEELDLILIK